MSHCNTFYAQYKVNGSSYFYHYNDWRKDYNRIRSFGGVWHAEHGLLGGFFCEAERLGNTGYPDADYWVYDTGSTYFIFIMIVVIFMFVLIFQFLIVR